MFTLTRQPNNQRGTFTVLGLMLFVGLIIPIFIFISNLAAVTNASSQAHGLAYNLAFAGVNRGVDGERTRQSGAVVMFRESLDGNNPDANQIDQLRQAYTEVNGVADTMKRASGLSGGSSRSTLTVQDAPQTPQTVGLMSGLSSITTPSGAGPARPMTLYSVSVDPIDAAFYTRLFNGGNDCNVGAGQAVGAFGNPTASLCWVDNRERTISPEVRDAYAASLNTVGGPSIDRSAFVAPSPWAHYTSGAEVAVRIESRLWFGGTWTDQKIGVAAFGRPCDASRESNIFGAANGVGAHCQY